MPCDPQGSIRWTWAVSGLERSRPELPPKSWPDASLYVEHGKPLTFLHRIGPRIEHPTPPVARPGSAGLKLHVRVANQLGLAIVRGDYAPGQTLPPEVPLCKMLGVSRTAMREAIRALAAKGMLDSRPKRGTQVRGSVHWNHLDPDVLRWRVDATDTETYLKKMFQLREATEPEACAIAATESNAADHTALIESYSAMSAAFQDSAKWVEADLAFHKTIYLATHNEFFWPIGQLFSFGLRHMFTIAAQDASHRQRALVEHADVLDAILARKPDLARAASETLLGNANKDIYRIRSGVSRP